MGLSILKSKVFKNRFIALAVLFNLPPVITPLFVSIGFEPISLIVLLGIWANVPLLTGLQYLFDSSSIVYGEFGMMNASVIVIFSIVIFWLICAALLAGVSLIFLNRGKKQKKHGVSFL